MHPNRATVTLFCDAYASLPPNRNTYDMDNRGACQLLQPFNYAARTYP